jgi:cytosine/adenosine deaminase-related metal-dependent hydrolase
MEIIAASYALPMTNGCPVVKDGAIAIELGKIHAFGTKAELMGRYPDADVHEFEDDILMPGLINAHCHLDLVSYYEVPQSDTESLSMAEGDFIETLIGEIDYKVETPLEKVIGGMQKGVERLTETGVTCVGDMTHYEGTFKILNEMGMRAVVFPEILAGRGEIAQQRFEVALALVDKYTDATDDRIRVGLGPYAPYLLSRHLLKIISQHARDASIPVQIHAAESFAEMEFFFDSQGPIATDLWPAIGWRDLPPAQRKTPMQYLSDIGFFEAPATVVGGLQLSAQDFPLLARHLSRVVWCPVTNKLMKHGAFPFSKLQEFGIPMGLGTEGWHSRMGFNLWDEMREAMKGSTNPAPTARDAVQMATVGGARALLIDPIVGTLQKGKYADYILVQAPVFDSEEECYERLVANTEPHHVHKVVVGGNILK